MRFNTNKGSLGLSSSHVPTDFSKIDFHSYLSFFFSLFRVVALLEIPSPSSFHKHLFPCSPYIPFGQQPLSSPHPDRLWGPHHVSCSGAGMKQPESECYHSSHFNTELDNVWSSASTSTYVFKEYCFNTRTLLL